MLNLSSAATPSLQAAAVVCTVPGFTNAAATPAISGGNGFIQIGSWRFGLADPGGGPNSGHFSFSSNNGRTSLILRCDGLYAPGEGYRIDWGLAHLPITWSSSFSDFVASRLLPNVQVGPGWIQFGDNIRMGSLDGLQLSVYFRTSFGLTTGSIGQTAGSSCNQHVFHFAF